MQVWLFSLKKSCTGIDISFHAMSRTILYTDQADKLGVVKKHFDLELAP